MSDWDAPSVHKMYSIAEKCLSEKKNRRPDIKMVCHLSGKSWGAGGRWLQYQLFVVLSVLLQVQQHLQEIKT